MNPQNAPLPAETPEYEQAKIYFRQNGIFGETTRYRRLDRNEAHYECTQYAHQKMDWWGMNADSFETISPDVVLPTGFVQPMAELTTRQKRPTAPYNLCKAIVQRFTGLLFSDARHPEVIVDDDQDTKKFLDAVIEQTQFWARWRLARNLGGAIGSLLMTVHVREGKFSIEVHNPKHVQILWKDRRALVPLAVLKCYRYPVEEDVIDPRTGERKGVRIVEYLYRRIITEEDDTVYRPARLDGDDANNWEIESEAKHGLHFFPGIWIQNMPVLEEEDGDPDCKGVYQNFDAIDRLLAQINKGTLCNLDPTLVIKKDPLLLAAEQSSGIRKGSDNSLNVGIGGSANYLEMGGQGVETGLKVVAQLKQNTLDVTGCVMVDPSTISGAAASAKAIEYIYAPMLERADDLRVQYGDFGVVALLVLIMRIARAYQGRPVKIGDRNGIYALDLPPQKDPITGKSVRPKIGPAGYVKIKWGPYFAPTEDDRQKATQNLTVAKGGGLISASTAVRRAASIFDVANPDDELKQIEADAQAMMGGFDDGSGGDVSLLGSTSPQASPPAGQGGKP